MPWNGNPQNFIIVHLQTTLPYKGQLLKINPRGNNYTTIYVGLPPELSKKVQNLAKEQGNKQKETESVILRHILDLYFKIVEKKGLPSESLRKTSPIGLKVHARTIRKEQDRKLRELADQTGWNISALIRKAVDTVKIEDVLSLKERKS